MKKQVLQSKSHEKKSKFSPFFPPSLPPSFSLPAQCAGVAIATPKSKRRDWIHLSDKPSLPPSFLPTLPPSFSSPAWAWQSLRPGPKDETGSATGAHPKRSSCCFQWENNVKLWGKSINQEKQFIFTKNAHLLLHTCIGLLSSIPFLPSSLLTWHIPSPSQGPHSTRPSRPEHRRWHRSWAGAREGGREGGRAGCK